MSIYTRAHYKALTNVVEQINIAFIVALVADLAWAVDSMLTSPGTVITGVVSGLAVSTLYATWACLKYHLTSYSKELDNLLEREDLSTPLHTIEASKPSIEDLESWDKFNSGC